MSDLSASAQTPTIDPASNGQRIQINMDADPTQETVRAASDMFRRGVDWVMFYREILGSRGVMNRLFSDDTTRQIFKQTAQFAEIQQMLAKLREKSPPPADSEEPTRVITVRLPACIHESLRLEARELQTSMNKLCISKLLQVIASELVPAD